MNLNQSPVQIARWLKSPNTDNIFEVDPTMFEPRLMFEQSLRRGLNSASRQVLGTYWAVAEGSGVASGKTNLKKNILQMVLPLNRNICLNIYTNVFII